MDNNTGFDSDDFECDDNGETEDDGSTYEPVPEPTPKDRFTVLVQQILSLHEGAGATYEKLEATVAPFDKELANIIRQCKVADDRLIAYCQRKVEQAKG